ncbi:ATP-dependent nuclease [Leptothoe sp. PORK10 BA2]|uniref:ATP-dependent nuclease n=1 Tax=Leptothoe sp. PORK10 BA2 TaxID=3110254 RepID=UPI002B216868|nr:AAA family ATPase [Leptothoe sp. PORK10 BA2]MEA5463206.1 AAA family ATPase [Leptothoe sp. PORK10 BA2]
MNSPLDSLSRSFRALEHTKIHIHSLRFPNYRNLEPNAELVFKFPITVLLGRNGTNKSSILHALYGSVRGKSIGDFWFETKLDLIPETRNGLKQSIVHRYLDENGDLVECIKARAPRRGNPDYWEPVRHTQLYGFKDSGVRISPVQLNVVHLDFRGELPAFDKYFYFPDPQHLDARDRDRKKNLDPHIRNKYSKQDYLRSRSSSLKKEISERGKSLTPNELEVLRYILERDYTGGKVLKHKLFHGHEGWTILFETEHLNDYSDAFAGSGESASTLLVHNILEAPDNSLILLDEPETSLHPGAQQRMLEFLAHQAVRKSLQIVIATHSTHFTELLPREAIQLLYLGSEGNVSVEANLSAQEAFHDMGSFPAGKTILVEDARARLIVSEILKIQSDQASKEFSVVVQPGGTAKIYRDIKAFANSKRNNIFVVFDGDHSPEESIPKDGLLPQGEMEVKALIDDLTKGNNSKGPNLNFEDVDDMTRYIRFFRKFVYFLPACTPEELVWNDIVATEILKKELPSNILEEENYKHKISLLSDMIPGVDPNAVFQFLLSGFLKQDSELKSSLVKCIQEIRSSPSTKL